MFSPRESFRDFNVESSISLAKLYPDDFGSTNLRDLRAQLNIYIADVREDNRFSNLNTISELAQKMVETGKNHCYALVHQLLKLVLVLPVATATIERCFSAMKLVKTYLSNKIGDEHFFIDLFAIWRKNCLRKLPMMQWFVVL